MNMGNRDVAGSEAEILHHPVSLFLGDLSFSTSGAG